MAQAMDQAQIFALHLYINVKGKNAGLWLIREDAMFLVMARAIILQKDAEMMLTELLVVFPQTNMNAQIQTTPQKLLTKILF